MFFNSLDFAIFLSIVFMLYWFVTQRNVTVQNVLLVIASYVFYGWWDWRFLSLIFFSTCVDFLIGIALSNTHNERKRKYLLWSSIIVNIGLLGFFKYYNFFVDSFVDAFTFFGANIQPHSLHIILPVGISFYTFQTVSYTIDVYKNKIEPTRNFIAFTAFVSFFPQLVAGPIERASNLLPQFYSQRTFDYTKAIDGMRQILWGLFKKVVIADNCAEYANQIFNNYTDYSGTTLLLGAVLFSFQIYGDFSGYTDIAIGTARLFGFNLMRNFAFPYFSRDIAEFWRRWHISLTTWFRDYVYIPLGGSIGSIGMKIRNTFIIFIVSGFWHGANWTFIAWGVYHALLFIPLLVTNKNRKHITTVAEHTILPSVKEMIQIIYTFILVSIGWIFFRSTTIQQALEIIYSIGIDFFIKASFVETYNYFYYPVAWLLFFIVFFVIIEWVQRDKMHALEICSIPRVFRWFIYIGLIMCIVFFSGHEQAFIYFQF